MIVELFTDGSANPNPGPGGWGFVARYGTLEIERCGGEANSTNNRMEMMAAIQALRCLTRPCEVVVHSDSQYVIKGITEWIDGWRRRGWRTGQGDSVKNMELWLELEAEVKRHKDVTWVWVRGHNGHRENEMADVLANRGRLEAMKG